MGWLEKNLASMRRGEWADQATCHRRDGRAAFEFGRGRLKWKKEVGRERGRNARRRGRIMAAIVVRVGGDGQYIRSPTAPLVVGYHVALSFAHGPDN